MRAPGLRALGLASLGIWALHLGNHLQRREWFDPLWACNVAPLLIGVGCLGRERTLLAVGTFWLILGAPLWTLYLLGGGELLGTSALVHVGGLAIGLVATRRLGPPRHAWLRGALALLGWIGVCRLLTPPALNVNLAFAVWPGWEDWFPSHGVYLLVLCAGGAALFAVAERVLGRAGSR